MRVVCRKRDACSSYDERCGPLPPSPERRAPEEMAMPFYVKPVVSARERERKKERETRNVVVVVLLLSSSDGNVPGIIFAKVPVRARVRARRMTRYTWESNYRRLSDIRFSLERDLLAESLARSSSRNDFPPQPPPPPFLCLPPPPPLVRRARMNLDKY